MIQDLLQERIVLSAEARTLFRKIANWAMPAAIIAITMALLSLTMLFNEIQKAGNWLHILILSVEWILFFTGNCCLLLFAIKLKNFATDHTAQFADALKQLRVGLVLLLLLLVIAVSYQVIWYSIQEFISNATG